jgi:hypothetical protein
MKDKMTRLEKVALTSAASGAVFNVFLYGIGATLHSATDGPLFYLRVGAAILQAAAFDLVAIATVMGMRDGRRSRWSMATAVASALVSAAIALDVAGVLTMPWLHAANALIVLAFTLHLLTPPKEGRARQLRRLARRLISRVRAAEQDVKTTEQMLAVARQELSSRQQPVTIEVIRVARYELTWEQTEQLARMILDKRAASMSSVRRYVAQLAMEEH